MELQFSNFPFDSLQANIELFWAENLQRISITRVTVLFLDTVWPGGSKFLRAGDIWRSGTPESIVENLNISNSYLVTKFRFQFERRVESYVMTVFIPLEILVVLQLTTFVMPPSSLDRGIYSVTVNLAFVVYQQVINEQLPKTSDSIFLLYYIVVYMAIGAFITIDSLVMTTVSELTTWLDRKFYVFKHKLPCGRLIDLVVFAHIISLITVINLVYFIKISK